MSSFARSKLHLLVIETDVDLNIAVVHPPELVELLPECSQVIAIFRVGLGMRHQHAYSAHPVGLLRANHDRPGSHATEDREQRKSASFLCRSAGLLPALIEAVLRGGVRELCTIGPPSCYSRSLYRERSSIAE
jgi:hypothetical protein